jgi:predicted O-methyltransferase YrrM
MEHMRSVFACLPESRVHKHAPEERGELFSALDPASSELEVLNFLNALVLLYKPRVLLETGTFTGMATLAIASALATNGFGTLHTVDNVREVIEQAMGRVRGYDPALLGRIEFHHADSRSYLAEYDGAPFDFGFFDSEMSCRHAELDSLLSRGKLSKGAVCVFHDSSPLRNTYAPEHDNTMMRRYLEEASAGRQHLTSELSRGFWLIRFT